MDLTADKELSLHWKARVRQLDIGRKVDWPWGLQQ